MKPNSERLARVLFFAAVAELVFVFVFIFFIAGCAGQTAAVIRTPYIEQVPDEKHGVICYRDRDTGALSCVRFADTKEPP